MSAKLPNIILVVLDTARRDRFGCYGYDRPTTPNVDALAREGMVVETMIANGPWTLPSHGSLFTGLYPAQHGSQWRSGPRLSSKVKITMAEWLKSLGYSTVCATTNGLISDQTGLARGFDRYAYRLDLEPPPRLYRRARRYVGTALFGRDSGGGTINRWLQRELRGVETPLFLFVNYLECHWQYLPPRRFERRVRGPRFRPVEGLLYRIGQKRRGGPWEAIAKADDRKRAIYSTLYDGELANADRHLGDLLNTLTASGHLNDGNTLVVVTSDHGEHIGEHGLADHHASLDDHLVRVPFVVWGPGLLDPKQKEGVYEFVDVLPSLASYLGKELPSPHLHGRRTDLFTADGTSKPGSYAFMEWRAWGERELGRLVRRNPVYDFTGLTRDLVAVRDAHFKLVRGSDGAELLFDLEKDPTEERDVASGHPDVVERLAEKLDETIRGWGECDGEESPLSEQEQREIEQHLSALGYI